jgi:hypothetical protein
MYDLLYIRYDLRMPSLRLYNFLKHDFPEGIPELLDLLGFVALWDRRTRRWQIYQDNNRPARLKWNFQEFAGGSTEDWQRFLSSITSTEYLL